MVNLTTAMYLVAERDCIKRQQETTEQQESRVQTSSTLSLFTGLLLPLDSISFSPSVNSTLVLFTVH